MEELKKDSEEFARLLGEATRRRVKDALTSAKAEVDREIVALEIKQRQRQEAKNAAPKRYYNELVEYAWDQSDKFVKLFVNLDGVQNLEETAVKVTFTSNSMQLHVSDLNGKDCGLTVNNLLEPINVAESYRKIKTGMVAMYLKKETEGRHWNHLTTIQRRLKEKQDRDMKSNMDNGDGNPGDAMMNIMKKMYQSGDTKTKQMIAKAWTESQENIHRGQHPDDMPLV